jgi:hypothetical protein
MVTEKDIEQFGQQCKNIFEREKLRDNKAAQIKL